MEPLDVDVDAVRRGADELTRAREGISQAFDAFRSAVGGYAHAFGGDEIGMLLGVAHQAVVDGLTECLSTNLTELENYAAGLHSMARRYRAAEDDAAGSFQSILGRLGG